MDLASLRAASPGIVVDVSDEALEAARADRSGHRATGRPLAVVRATEVEHVQAALRWASAHGVPVVPRGAGTGLAGGANTGEGELSIDVSGMRRILEVSAADQLAVVEPGILNADLNAALAEHGMWWAPDPASRAISTVGGNIATNAGGLLCAKYGVTREAVLALGVVLASGERIDVGHRTVKGVTGLDLAALMIGSEGTLGIIVEATLRLRPVVPGGIWTIGAFFDDEVAAAAACAAITAARIRPAIMELVGTESVRMLAAYTGRAMRGAFVLVQVDDVGAEAIARDALAIVEAHGGDAELTDDVERSAMLVEVRRQVHFALDSFGTVLVEDVSVPRTRMPDMFALCADVAKRYGVTVATSAHAGDGNLHPTFVFDEEEPTEEIWAAADEIFRGAIAMGGTLTGEHGVGVLKRRWLGLELGDTQLRLQREIKAVFDPAGILNPGKVFEV
ncbi:FAD-binding oxidoreductase [Agrococcus sp. SGAir0287]|uniref:FAD-binding oxidoreductase n=1 Tax=Agrococcus sp. SGAir0287 TaxID=2070347 RepID=UPI0010CD60A2|nr:FAD-linked oxidase C-terminal domain-containing protein [Agrococcus sp. SGAir0287]QCR18444.1 FAD-binding oxidoreductase [Agrococcus sp. SGAir0287]